jgi:hypothetical protein
MVTWPQGAARRRARVPDSVLEISFGWLLPGDGHRIYPGRHRGRGVRWEPMPLAAPRAPTSRRVQVLSLAGIVLRVGAGTCESGEPHSLAAARWPKTAVATHIVAV